ncbi:MAG TPA: DsbC family protein [Casimicrobiaceae bacterium]
MQRNENRRLHRLCRAFAIGATMLACAVSVAAAQTASGTPAQPAAAAPPAAATQPAAAQLDGAQAPTGEAAAVKKLLEDKFPSVAISHVGKTGYLGLYEAMIDDKLVYTDASVAYIFIGSMYDTTTKQNLTEARSRKLNRVAVDKLPYELAFKRVKGDGSRKLIIFSDADCPFCHRLENEMKGLDNVTIYTFLFPIDQLHPDAARKSKQIWCSTDKVKAWDEFFSTGKLPNNKGDCGDPVAKTQALGSSLHINATPTLIFADGTLIPGALPLPQLEKEINNGETEAKKLAAAPK